MGAVTRQAHLHRRGEIYYCRIALPKTLAIILGRGEYKKSLKTSDLRIARIKCRELSNRMEAFFIMVKALRPKEQDIKALVRHYFEDCLAEGEDTLSFETVTSRSRFIDEYDPQAIIQTADLTRQALAGYADLKRRHVYGEREERDATRLLQAHGYELNTDSELFAEFCLGIVRAGYESERIKLGYFTGNYAEGDIRDPLFKDCRNYFADPDPEYASKLRQNQGRAFTDVPAKITLQQAIDQYLANRKTTERDGFSNEQAKRVGTFLKRLAEILGSGRNVSDITEQDAHRVEEVLYSLPRNYARDHQRNGSSILDAVKADSVKLDVRTINSYLIAHKAFFRWCRKMGYVSVDPMQDIEVRKKRQEDEEVRLPFSGEQLRALFQSALYTGRANAERTLWKRGKLLVRDGNFWLPLIALYTGMRMGEILFLQPSDVQSADGIWYIDVNKDEEGKRLKNVQSKRKVPLHPDLIKLGFLAYVPERQKSVGLSGRIFADGITLPENQSVTKNYSRKFSDYTVKAGIRADKDNKFVFHSFRHNFHDAMDAAGVPNVITCRITGHEPPKDVQTTGDRVYLHNKPNLAVLHEAVAKINYGLDLSHLIPEGA